MNRLRDLGLLATVPSHVRGRTGGRAGPNTDDEE